MMHPRVHVTVGANANATVIESYASIADARYFTNAVTAVSLGAGATLRHYKIQREAARAFHVGTIEAHQARDSHYISFALSTGASLSRTNVYTTLDGSGSGATLNGLYMLDGAQHCDHQTQIIHAQPNCFSRELYKGVLDDRSHGVFNGKVYVHPIAQKTDGKQTNKTLLLSGTAQVDTKPQLEIFADDVKCTHGATIGQIDQTALFYMKSRGIAAETARRLLTYAFAADVLETIEVAGGADDAGADDPGALRGTRSGRLSDAGYGRAEPRAHPRAQPQAEELSRHGRCGPHRRGRNPMCGDELTVWLKLSGDRIDDVSFRGSGCAISKASASLMTNAVKGKTRAEALELFDRFHRLVTGTLPADEESTLGRSPCALGGVSHAFRCA